MALSVAFHRILRVAALICWALLGLPGVLGFQRHKYGGFSSRDFALWLTAFTVFGSALWLSSRWETGRSRTIQIVALTLQSIAALAMIYLLPNYYFGFLLVIVSWQLGLFFSVPIAFAWGVVQTAVLLYFYVPTCDFGWGWAATGTYIGFQAFAMITAFVARSEAALRKDLSRTNAELQATRELLAESARGAERIRISGELHDLLGHNLTALSLHLEVASHKTNAEAVKHIGQAQRISKQMLGDVRGVVSALRHFDHMDTCRALESICRDIPHLNVHLTYPENLHIEDAWRAQVLLRCVREVITNALKHAQAEHLWVEISSTTGGLILSARDDGKGKSSVVPGLGLSDMQTRLEEIGGKLRFESEASDGFRLQAWLPLEIGGTA